MKAKITLDLSEAQWDLYPEQAEDGSHTEFVVDLPDGPWVQFTYNSLRDHSGGTNFGDLHFGDDGFAHHDGKVWSDVTIELLDDSDIGREEDPLSEGDVTVEFLVDGKPVEVGNDVRVVAHFPAGFGVNYVQFVLTQEGFIGDAFNESGECFRTQAFTFDEFGDVEPETAKAAPKPPWGTYRVWEQVRRGKVPYTADPDPIVDELNRLAAVIEYVVKNAYDEEEKQRCGALIYEKLHQLSDVRATLTVEQIKLLETITTRLLVDVFDVEPEKIDLSREGSPDGK